jgi:hypothetical protein
VRPIGLTLEHVNLWDAEVLNAERVIHSNSICFWLSNDVVRCCSHLAQPYEGFHKQVGKTCGMICDQSLDVRRSHVFWLESGIQPKSCLPTTIEHTTGVTSSDRSQAYDQSHVFWLKSSIWSKAHLSTRVGHTTGHLSEPHFYSNHRTSIDDHHPYFKLQIKSNL